MFECQCKATLALIKCYSRRELIGKLLNLYKEVFDIEFSAFLLFLN